MIRFPKQHIADSVTARILASIAQIDPNSVQGQGAHLTEALRQPIGDVAPIEGIEDAVAAKALDL